MQCQALAETGEGELFSDPIALSILKNALIFSPISISMDFSIRF